MALINQCYVYRFGVFWTYFNEIKYQTGNISSSTKFANLQQTKKPLLKLKMFVSSIYSLMFTGNKAQKYINNGKSYELNPLLRYQDYSRNA